MMIQQSNCFIVVERGIGMQNMMQERALAESGELRQGSNMGGGQMVSADFVLTPALCSQENDAGGVGGALGGLLGGSSGRVVGAVAGGVKFKEAQTSMLVADARTGVQVAAAEGSAKKADLRLGGVCSAAARSAALGGYANTNEGKMLAASLMDNYNNIVRSVRGQPSLHRDVGTLAEEAGKKNKGGAVFNEGDTVVPKIGNLKLYSQPSEPARPSHAQQGRRNHRHGRGAGRLHQGRDRRGRWLGEEGAGREIATATDRIAGEPQAGLRAICGDVRR